MQNPIIMMWIICILIILYSHKSGRKKKQTAIILQIQKCRKENKEMTFMKELAMRMIGRDCIIYTLMSNDGSLMGIIQQVNDGALILQKSNGECEIINLDFVTRIREFPKDKNGKKKSFFV